MGQGYICRCPGCGHEEKLLFGIGFTNPAEAIQERENILAGIYGPKPQKAIEAHPEIIVDVELAPYQCKDCGTLDIRRWVRLNPSSRISIQQHCDCGGVMHRIRRNGKVICPICGETMTQAEEIGYILWD